jgi:hypothetical protein|uniref:Uncharacterized protein n=1 Tax=Sipha flava TaxID=143950 RepID=A0A2S2QWP7_9HEMI
MDEIETKRSSPEAQLENNDQLQSYDPPVAKRPIYLYICINVKINSLSRTHLFSETAHQTIILSIFFFFLYMKDYIAVHFFGIILITRISQFINYVFYNTPTALSGNIKYIRLTVD